MAEAEAGEWKIRGILTGLEAREQGLQRRQQGIRLPFERRGCGCDQPTAGLPEQHHGPMEVATLTMEKGHRELHHPLQPAPFWLIGLVPEFFKKIVGAVPVTLVEEGDCPLKARISLKR